MKSINKIGNKGEEEEEEYYDDRYSNSCDQRLSRYARSALEEFFYPSYDDDDDDDDNDNYCPFKKSRDIYLDFENNKSKRKNGWRCEYDGKVFNSEEEIDLYMRKYYFMRRKKKHDICLADYCNVLKCSEYRKSLPTSSTHNIVDDDVSSMGNPKAFCYALAKKCFPERERNEKQEMRARRFERVFCDTRTHLVGRNTFEHFRKIERRKITTTTRADREPKNNSASSHASFMIVATLFISLALIYYSLAVLVPTSSNRRASASDFNRRRTRSKIYIRSSVEDFFARALVITGFRAKKKKF